MIPKNFTMAVSKEKDTYCVTIYAGDIVADGHNSNIDTAMIRARMNLETKYTEKIKQGSIIT